MVRRIRLVALGFALVAAVLAIGCARACSCDGRPIGPEVAELPPDQGLLIVRFPDRPPGWDARVRVFDKATPEADPTGFPIRIPVSLGKDGVVEAWATGYEQFRQGFTVTADRREVEVVIRLVEARSSGNFGFALSELPRTTGFQADPSPSPGQPAPLLFDNSSGSHDDFSDDWSGFSIALDQGGVAWRQNSDSKRGVGPWTRLGTVTPTVVAHMRKLLTDVPTGELVLIPQCYEVGPISDSIFAYPGGEPRTARVTLAQNCKRLPSRAASEIVAWLVALKIQILESSK